MIRICMLTSSAWCESPTHMPMMCQSCCCSMAGCWHRLIVRNSTRSRVCMRTGSRAHRVRLWPGPDGLRVAGWLLVLLLPMLVACGPLAQTTAVPSDLPHVVLLDPAVLRAVRQSLAHGDATHSQALQALRVAADQALQAGPYTVVTQPNVPPGADRHDYVSLARYWWPNPATPDGLPYIRRDGQPDPALHTYPDPEAFTQLQSTLQTLTLAYYFTADERYAGRAALLLQRWFLDPATRMNPTMQHAQLVPGRNDGSAGGILDLRDISQILDWVGLLDGSPAWTAVDQQGMQSWCAQYLTWLLSSAHGLAEARAANNHGSWYDVQVVALALFVGRQDVARSTLEQSRTRRIAAQILPDGRQPQELQRATSWDYSLFNLAALFRLASLGERAGIDLWHYQTADGRSLQSALDYLLPFARHLRPWPDQQITSLTTTSLLPLLRAASQAYRDPQYARLADELGGPLPIRDRSRLLMLS